MARETLRAAGGPTASSRGGSLHAPPARNRESLSLAVCAERANRQLRAPRLLSRNAAPLPEKRFCGSLRQNPQRVRERAPGLRSNVRTTSSPRFLPAASSDWRYTRAAPSTGEPLLQCPGSKDSAGCWYKASPARAKSNRRGEWLRPPRELRARVSDSVAICESVTCLRKSSFRREPFSRFRARLGASHWQRSKEKSCRESPALCWKRAPLP